MTNNGSPIKNKKPLLRKTPLKRSKVKLKAKGVSSIDRLLGEGLVFKASTLVSKPRKRIRARRPRRKGEVSQVDVFNKIWDERPHVSQISGEPLVEKPDNEEDMSTWLSQFSHLLNKGHYKAFKLREDNIWLKTFEEHAYWERNKLNTLNAYVSDMADGKWPPGSLDGWKACCEWALELRDEANGLRS